MQQAVSDDLLLKMSRLTARQREAIPRLVRALADGSTMRALLRGPDRICCWSTYYKPGRGWYHNEAFREVLEQARREYDAARLKTAVEEAAATLRRTTPLAARVLEQEIVRGLRSLDDVPDDECTFEERSLRLLARVAEGAVQLRALEALSKIRGAERGRGLKAATAVLDRADVETAVKSAGGAEAQWRGLLEELRSDADEMADVETEAGDLPAPGLPATRGAVAGTPEPGAGNPGGGGREIRQEPLDR